jgi:hypothetical protein
VKCEYYTYAYLRIDGTPYYIGKGKGKRAYNNHKHVPVPPLDRILILKKNLTDEEAKKHEVYMIFVLGRKNLGTGRLINLTEGGESKSGWICPPEYKERWAGKNNGMYGKSGEQNPNSKLTDLQRQSIREEYIPRARGNGYGNGTELAKKYGVDSSTIRRIVHK